jgi:membrane-bound lytic murein transglycosylase A
MNCRAFTIAALALLLLAQCTRRPPASRAEALLPTPAPEVIDDLPLDSLRHALTDEIAFLRAHPATAPLRFASKEYSAIEYADALEAFLRLTGDMNAEQMNGAYARYFDFYEVYGDKKRGQVLVTSYFEPELSGSRHRTDRYRQPLYRAPDDLVAVALDKYDNRLRDVRMMRGRLVEDANHPGRRKLVPYYTRSEIDEGRALARRGLELCWLDPIEAFFLQVQGSGTVTLDDGSRIRVGYADQNGHPFQPIGKYLTDVIPLSKMSQQKLESYLRGLSPVQAMSLMGFDSSYIFFQEMKENAVTSLGIPAVAGRTIATDGRFFPKGALALLTFPKPRFGSPDSDEPTDFVPTTRLVLDQDTGGAIHGGGRVDLFWGRGESARRSAGVIKGLGTLYYLAPNGALLAEITK